MKESQAFCLLPIQQHKLGQGGTVLKDEREKSDRPCILMPMRCPGAGLRCTGTEAALGGGRDNSGEAEH